MTYSQRTPTSCGPDALAYAMGRFGLSQGQVDKAWGIDNIQRFGNLQDTPWNHFAAIQKLGFSWIRRTCGDFLAGRATPERTIVLGHNPENPILKQHWVVYAGTNTVTRQVLAHWGDGSPRPKMIAFDQFSRLYSGGKNVGPQCAYEVCPKGTPGSEDKLPWYIRLYASITGKFC